MATVLRLARGGGTHVAQSRGVAPTPVVRQDLHIRRREVTTMERFRPLPLGKSTRPTDPVSIAPPLVRIVRIVRIAAMDLFKEYHHEPR